MGDDQQPITISVREAAWLLALMRVKLADRLRRRAREESRAEVAKAIRLIAEEFERVGLKELL